MFDSIIEMVKLIGGLAGFASSGFLIYDRVFRLRPTAFLVPVDYKTHLVLKNVAAETLVIDEIAITPPMLKLAKANDLVTPGEEKSAVFYRSAEEKLPKGIYIVLKPMEERSFALHRFAEFENADGATKISIKCRWGNTRKPFPFNRHVWVQTTVSNVRNLREASLAGKV